MRTKALASVALAIPFVAFASLATNAAHNQSRACVISAPDTVRVGLKSTVLKAKYTEMIGDSVTASFPMLAKIAVFAVMNSTMDSPPSVELTLNTERALPGTWRLSLTGDRGVCVGEVAVATKPA
jgi:hypothetical protein